MMYSFHLAVEDFSELGLGDVAEHEAEQLGDAPGFWKHCPHLLPRFQALPQPVVPVSAMH